jgi:hypothetical protein
MLTVTCDVCRKKIDDPFYGRTFFYFAYHNVCEDCKEDLDYQVRDIIREQEPFDYNWYGEYVTQSLDKAVQKGKF